MMTQQAKDLLVPIRGANCALRSYPTDSPRAKARIVVLALLADGHLDATELDSLSRRNAFAALGIAREDFFQVLYDFCADLVDLPTGNGSYLLSPAVLASLFAEIRSPVERQKLLRLIFAVIRSDGHLDVGEARLFWSALDAWDLRLDDGIELAACETAAGQGKPLQRSRGAGRAGSRSSAATA